MADTGKTFVEICDIILPPQDDWAHRTNCVMRAGKHTRGQIRCGYYLVPYHTYGRYLSGLSSDMSQESAVSKGSPSPLG